MSTAAKHGFASRPRFVQRAIKMDGQSTPVPARNGLLNIVRNLAWILGGKTFGAICSLVYLAVLARSLGLRDFGHFSLLFGTAQALVAIAGFQTWQTLVRFGARHRLDVR
jgi:O-antigen/teichoic acid export membrane protein